MVETGSTPPAKKRTRKDAGALANAAHAKAAAAEKRAQDAAWKAEWHEWVAHNTRLGRDRLMSEEPDEEAGMTQTEVKKTFKINQRELACLPYFEKSGQAYGGIKLVYDMDNVISLCSLRRGFQEGLSGVAAFDEGRDLWDEE